jgi:NDP-sugar pyrophosphorylase family protein
VNVDLGVLIADGDRVSDYIEKPTYTYDVSMGVYALSKSVLKYVPPDTYFDFPMLIKALLAQGEYVRAAPFDGIWLDIGRPADYEDAQTTLATLRDRLLPPG